MSLNKYLVLPTVEDFNVLNATMNTAFGYPSQYAQTYAEPIMHADEIQCLFVVEPRCIEHLSPEQNAALLNEIPADWQFPAPPVEPPPEE